MQRLHISTSVAGIERVVEVEIQVHSWQPVGPNVVYAQLLRLFGGRRGRDVERKRAVGSSYRALRPQGIDMTDFVDEGCHGIGIEFRKAVGITKIRPQDGRPLGIIMDGGLGSGIERT